jgi:hypothetical protein
MVQTPTVAVECLDPFLTSMTNSLFLRSGKVGFSFNVVLSWSMLFVSMQECAVQ